MTVMHNSHQCGYLDLNQGPLCYQQSALTRLRHTRILYSIELSSNSNKSLVEPLNHMKWSLSTVGMVGVEPTCYQLPFLHVISVRGYTPKKASMSFGASDGNRTRIV